MELIIRLREERAALVARLAQIDQMLSQYEEWGRAAQRLISLTNQSNHESEKTYETQGDQTGVPSRAYSGEGVPSHAAKKKTPIKEFQQTILDILRESMVPMDRVALYDALISRGVVIGDGDREKDLNVLSARVYRLAQETRLIVSERGQGYRWVGDHSDGVIVDGDDLLV